MKKIKSVYEKRVSSAYIRSGPGQNYPVIDSVTQGSTVTVLGYTNNTAWNKQGGTYRIWTGIMMARPVNRCLSWRFYM
jgi:uncharacterized protein YgiM (DUF1202 family)